MLLNVVDLDDDFLIKIRKPLSHFKVIGLLNLENISQL